MKPKKVRSQASKRRVSFTFYGPEAKDVFLVGDFNQWNEEAHPMKMDSNGVWRKSIFVSPGAYEYRFKADGAWENDQNNDMVCENSFGTHNNILVIDH